MLILDAGAFIALERNERAMWRRLKAALIADEPPMTHGGVVGQVWRGGTGREVQIVLQAVETVPLDLQIGQQAVVGGSVDPGASVGRGWYSSVIVTLSSLA